MKKISVVFAFMFVFIFAFSSTSLNTFAEDKTEKSYSSLEELAKDYLVKVTRIDKKGVTTVTVRNIPEFTEAAHKYFPEIDDITIARFVYKYTGQEEKAEVLPDDKVLEILDSEEKLVQAETLVPEKDAEAEKDTPGTVNIILGVAAGILIVAGAVIVVIKNKKEK